MLPTQDIVHGVAGALRLAKFDADALDDFDTTHTGFWRSFYAALLILPLFWLFLATRFVSSPPEAPFVHFMIIQTLAYAIAWLAFPVVMATVVRFLDRDEHFIRYIVAYNWISVLQNGVYLPIIILYQAVKSLTH